MVLNSSPFQVQGKLWIFLFHQEDMPRAKGGRNKGESWQMASDLSLSKSPFCSSKQWGLCFTVIKQGCYRAVFIALWINLSECFSWPYGCGVRKDEKLAFRGGSWLLGSPMAAHCAIIAIMLYSAGAGLHQPHPAAHISALPRGGELSPAAGHTLLWSMALVCVVLSRTCGKW